jgi:maleate cis-trans isomerase
LPKSRPGTVSGSTGIYTAFQAIVWDALRQLGVNDGIDGCGRLLREL